MLPNIQDKCLFKKTRVTSSFLHLSYTGFPVVCLYVSMYICTHVCVCVCVCVCVIGVSYARYGSSVSIAQWCHFNNGQRGVCLFHILHNDIIKITRTQGMSLQLNILLASLPCEHWLCVCSHACSNCTLNLVHLSLESVATSKTVLCVRNHIWALVDFQAWWLKYLSTSQ